MSKKPYLIALDLDGTLLTEDKRIAPRTKIALQKAKDHGHIIIIATGRPYRASARYYQELSLDTPIVNFNGAYVHHPKDKYWKSIHSPLHLNAAKAIIESCDAFQVENMFAESINQGYLHRSDHKMLELFSIQNVPIQTGNLLKYLREDPTSLLVFPREDQVDSIKSRMEKSYAEMVEYRNWGTPWNVIEIVRSGVNKWIGIKHIADQYQIPPGRIIAFGDEDNDLEMIEFAGQGIAMGNAIDKLKNIANAITKSNENEGVAVFLEEALAL